MIGVRAAFTRRYLFQERRKSGGYNIVCIVRIYWDSDEWKMDVTEVEKLEKLDANRTVIGASR